MSSSESEDASHDEEQRASIREDLSKMSFEEILKLKEELGAKLYKEAVLGVDNEKNENSRKSSASFKRLNKNRPRELSAKRQVPFIAVEPKSKHKTEDNQTRDPRFDANCGDFNVKHFKENYKFLMQVRQKDIARIQKQLRETTDDEERKELRLKMQKLINKNVEEKKWHTKQKILNEEKLQIQQAVQNGQRPHYTTKKERRAKELVTQFEQLKESGKLSKHLEKRRKKNAAKDNLDLNSFYLNNFMYFIKKKHAYI